MLLWDDFLSWCGSRLVVAAGAGRYATSNKALLVASAPGWRGRPLSRDRLRSWISPACSPDGRLVAASAGPNDVEPRFGLEARSIWLLAVDGAVRRKLTSPPRGRTDELPRWSRDGRFVLFVRSGPTRDDTSASGAVYLVRVADRRIFGPLAHVRGGNYYGHYSFPLDPAP
jgi:dipeptidyl aminopeptidase/acylaminoacyl peptidase